MGSISVRTPSGSDRSPQRRDSRSAEFSYCLYSCKWCALFHRRTQTATLSDIVYWVARHEILDIRLWNLLRDISTLRKIDCFEWCYRVRTPACLKLVIFK